MTEEKVKPTPGELAEIAELDEHYGKAEKVKPKPNHGPWMMCPVCGITVFCPQCEDRKKEADE